MLKTTKKISPETEKLKMEIARELGLADKIKQGGYSSLTCKEAGQIGARMANRTRLPKNRT